MAFEQRTKAYQAYIQRYLDAYIAQWETEPQQKLFSAMRYSLLAGGKRLRPIFTFEFCRLCCGEWEKAAPLAAAVEMIHTYSLIHDDLPCMDNDDFRRGRLTNHKVFGEAIAVLAGDALLTDAFSIAAGAEIPGMDMARVIGTLAGCAGSLGMVGGQVLDMLSEERECTEQEILDVQSRKTGALINAACAMGVLAGQGSEEQLQAACGFAGLLGLAFQIRDDVLDVIGNAADLGKATGMDEGKNTFVRLYGLEKCQTLVQEYTEKAVGLLDVFADTAYIRHLAKAMTCRNT
ncbi:MAG TPA: polyprenyl synthetase family protein [Candidatus Faecousia intestinigallinarum]|nr:polyprenyl synthetase family protein [Candidatus Faecousia intestinigallinarum]